VTLPDDVLAFWFEGHGAREWFQADPAFDAAVAARFAATWEEAAAGGLARWRETSGGCLALVIVLDQFPRNMFRGTARAFATDAMARGVALHALDRGFDRDPGFDDRRRQFFYLPFEHSEDPADQALAVRLVEERTRDPQAARYARAHARVIERFGRFPHRNAVLGRTSTPAELAFLKAEGRGF
jgi:uncharacterized protein (DUF924 family)